MNSNNKNIVITSAVRTAIGIFKGSLKNIQGHDLGSAAVKDSMKKSKLKPNEVVGTFSKYDLFLFPSGGENYGHVIAESLSSGTPVLISKNTPWLDLESQNLGWDIDLKDMDSFVEIIERSIIWCATNTQTHFFHFY